MRTSHRSSLTVTKTLFIFNFLLITAMAFAQDTLKAGKPIDIGKPNECSYRNKWQYFKLQDTLTVKVIDHLPAPAFCGILATASITIVETLRGDTYRIIDMCNVSDKYKKGQTIKVAPADKPPFGLATAFTLKENPKTKKIELLPSEYDLAVLKTTWGSLLAN